MRAAKSRRTESLGLHVVVAIVGFRNPSDILRCLSALGQSTYPDFEVLICENGGPQAYQDLLRQTPATLAGGQAVRTVLGHGNTGFAGGVNRCIAETAGADAWWLLNPDTEVFPDAMAAMVERLATGEFEAVGSTVVFPNGVVQAHGGRWRGWLAAPQSIGHGSPISQKPDRADVERRQNYILGTSMMINRRFLDRVSPMDESYFLYCEEVEWCLRARKLGMRLGFAEGAIVRHHNGTTTGAGEALNRRARLPVYLGERNKILLTKDCYPARLPIAIFASLAFFTIRCIRRGAWKQIGYGVSGWLAGLSGERGRPSFSSYDAELLTTGG